MFISCKKIRSYKHVGAQIIIFYMILNRLGLILKSYHIFIIYTLGILPI